jgi:elongation factor P
MKIAKDLRTGNVIKYCNKIYSISKAELHKSTAGRRASTTEVKFKLRDILTGDVKNICVDATSKMDYIVLDKHNSQFLYKDTSFHFMNIDNFEQFEVEESIIEDAKYFLKQDTVYEILFYENKPVSIELPKSIVLTIKYTEPGLKGDTTGKAMKNATLDSDLEIQVPLFCGIGDSIKVDTKSFEYIERV